MNLCFYIAHQVAGRTRLRATERVSDPTGLARAADSFQAIEGITEVTARTTTGSLIIEHEDLPWAQVAVQAEAQGVMLVEPPLVEARSGLDALQTQAREVNALLREGSGGAMDMRTAGFVLMLGLAATQLMRGNLLAPASTYLWYALNLARDGGKKGS